jgi:hypothetical protein
LRLDRFRLACEKVASSNTNDTKQTNAKPNRLNPAGCRRSTVQKHNESVVAIPWP